MTPRGLIRATVWERSGRRKIGCHSDHVVRRQVPFPTLSGLQAPSKDLLPPRPSHSPLRPSFVRYEWAPAGRHGRLAHDKRSFRCALA